MDFVYIAWIFRKEICKTSQLNNLLKIKKIWYKDNKDYVQ